MSVVHVGVDCLPLRLSLTDLQRCCKAVALFWLHNPGDHQRTHRPATSPAKTSGGGIKRGASGHHIINQQYRPAGKPGTFNRRDVKGTGKITDALLAGQTGLRSARSWTGYDVWGKYRPIICANGPCAD